MPCPAENHQVDMSKVKLSVMKPWITRRVTELLGVEDDVLINFIFSQLEEKVYLSVFSLFPPRLFPLCFASLDDGMRSDTDRTSTPKRCRST